MSVNILMPFDLPGFRVEAIEARACTLTIRARAIPSAAQCPDCGVVSERVHSYYTRSPGDWPISDHRVHLVLHVRRFRCGNPACGKTTFAERLPELVMPHAQRTVRLNGLLRALGFALGGEGSVRLAPILHLGVSADTILRIMRRTALAVQPTPRVLGVDDWAQRKGQDYGTILVDLERGEIVDLLADRTAETLSIWLKAHPGIEIVTRDRSQTYADAIRLGAPKAIQVADRWHLLKNLSDAVFKLLQQEQATIKKHLASMAVSGATGNGQIEQPEVSLPVGLEALTWAEQRRGERMELARQLYTQGWTQKGIAHHLNIHPKTVRRYLQAVTPVMRRHRQGRRLLNPFKGYILKRWNEGCHNAAQLCREIQRQGYPGRVTIVRDFVQQLRQASGLPPKVRSGNGYLLNGDPTKQPPSLRALTWFIVKQPERRSPADEKLLAQMSANQPKLATTVRLARDFAEMVKQQQPEKLDMWLKQANECGFQTWRNFATSLQQDSEAVRAALIYSWSNGPTEGHVNRLKCVKRQMYGRAKFDLLRLRLLYPP